MAKIFDDFGTRQIGAARMMARAVPLALAANARHAVRQRRGRGGPEPLAGAGAGRWAPERASAGAGTDAAEPRAPAPGAHA